MTVTYTGEVATCTGLGCFWKLLFRWRGSIYKLLWPNLVVYSILYFSLSGTYRFLLNSDQKTFFEKMSLHCQVYGDLIPVSFVLGFYVSLVIKRWWDQYLCLPWPDNLALFVSALIHGQDERGRMMRRTIMRYVNLSLLLTLRMISPRVKKRFPTLDHVVEAGWMLPGEKKIYEDLDQKTHHSKYWMPLVWAGGIVTRAKKENRIKDDLALKTLIDELNIFRGGCGGMLNYDWISIPLVYTQVVTLAVYIFFLSTLMGNQYLDPNKGYPKHQIDLFVPVFTFLQFFFYMGWLKVAESLVNPFGEDDDDFELNWLLDRNLQVRKQFVSLFKYEPGAISYVIVDEMHQEHPEMLKDQYWDEVFPAELPYTAAAKQYQTGPPQHSAEEVQVPSKEAEFMPLDTVVEDKVGDVSGSDSAEEDIDIQVDHPSVQRGETHPMKIKRRSRTPSGVTTSVSERSSLSSKGKSSVLNLLSRIFHHKRNSKEEVNQLGSSASLRSRRGNRSTSRISSVSHSMAPSRSSFAREGAAFNDFQLEVFAMSDLDIPDSAYGITDESDQKVAATPTPDICRSVNYVSKNESAKETGDGTDPKIPHCSIPHFDRKEFSPNQMMSSEGFDKRDSLARIVFQNNSPVYHVFAPVNSTAFIPSLKIAQMSETNKQSFSDSNVLVEQDAKQKTFGCDLYPESLITIMPPTEAAQYTAQNALKSGEETSAQRNSPSTSISCVGSVPQLQDTTVPPLYTCVFSTQPLAEPALLETPLSSGYVNDKTDVKITSMSKVEGEKQELSEIGRKDEDKPETYIEPVMEPLISEMEELKMSTAPDPTTPSAAIPVPAMSQAHASSPGDIELGRRTLMHELEPIMEHRDEGTSSIGSSGQDMQSVHLSLLETQQNTNEGVKK